MDEPRIGYMDLVDYEYEVGIASGGNKVYPSVDDLKQNSPCWKTCGVVKVEVKLLEVIEPYHPERLTEEESKE